MKKKFIANIDWMTSEEGGRKKILPKGTRYCPLIRIYNGKSYDDWSIDFVCPDFDETKMISFCFYVEEAPCELLKKNVSYDIYEGSKKVAKIKVIDIQK